MSRKGIPAKRVTDQQKQEFVSMANAGISADKIAEVTGVSRMTVIAWLKKLGVAYSYSQSILIEKEQQILSMHRAGATINKIR